MRPASLLVPHLEAPENCPSKSERATQDLTLIHYIVIVYNIPMSIYRCIAHWLRLKFSQDFKMSRTKRMINAFPYMVSPHIKLPQLNDFSRHQKATSAWRCCKISKYMWNFQTFLQLFHLCLYLYINVRLRFAPDHHTNNRNYVTRCRVICPLGER